jgi:sialic acid synthase SpsE
LLLWQTSDFEYRDEYNRERYKAVAIFDKHNIPVALLHTTNLYPTPIHLVRLGAMTQMQEAFPDKVLV